MKTQEQTGMPSGVAAHPSKKKVGNVTTAENKVETSTEKKIGSDKKDEATENLTKPDQGRESETPVEIETEERSESAHLKNELLRLHADMENTKKRLTRLFEDRVRDKTISLLLDVIAHIDNFERAFESQRQMKQVQNLPEQNDLNAIFDGFNMIKLQFLTTLENNWGLKAMNALEQEFNPDKHEAILQENSDKVKQPTVVQELMKGYTYLDKVIRPAKVKVAIPKENKL